MHRLRTPNLPPLPRNVWVLTLASLLNDISSEMLVYLLPLFLTNVLGAGFVAMGLIEGVAETTSSLLKGWSGWLSDRMGRRKPLTVAGYALSTVVKPLLGVATQWPVVLGARFTDRVGKGIRTAPRDALIADSVEPARRGLAFGLHRAGDTLGAAIGLAVALAVVWLVQGSAARLEAQTFRLLVGLSVVPAAGAVLLLALALREHAPTPRARSDQPPARRLPPCFRLFLGILVLFTLGNSSDAFLVLRAQERGVSVLGVMALWLLFNLVYAVLSGPLSAMSDRLGRRRVLRSGWLLYAAVYAGFALANQPWHLVVLFALYGTFYALTEGTAKAFVADLVPAEARGTAYGLYNAGVGLAALPASVLAGVLWQGIGGWPGWGPAAPFWCGAALALIAVGLLGRLGIGD